MIIGAYNEEEQMFETTLEKSKAMLKVGFEKLKVIEHGMDVRDPRDNMMLLTGEEIRIEHGQCFKNRRAGADGKEGWWRRCRADGEFFREVATQKSSRDHPINVAQCTKVESHAKTDRIARNGKDHQGKPGTHGLS